MRRDQRGRSANRRRGLEDEAAAREVEVVSGERVHVAVVESARSEAEYEEDRRPVLQKAGEESCVRCLLRIRTVRRDDRLAELWWEPALREVEGLEPSELREVTKVLPALADGRGPGEPRRDLGRSLQILRVGKPERGEVRIEGEGDRRGARDRAAMRLGEPHAVVGIEEAEGHTADGHDRRYTERYFELPRRHGRAVELSHYTIDGGRLAGLPGPAYMEWDFARLRKMGFSVVVSLECDRLNTFEIEDAGFEHKKICVEDFTAPTFDQIDEFVAFVDGKLAQGKKVLVHCYAGRGRTGTMLAAYLIHQGMSADAAIREIRERAAKAYGTLRGVIEPEQEEMLYRYEHRLRGVTSG